MTPFNEWSAEHPEIAISEEWTFTAIDVDLSGAVTMVVDLGAKIELGESEGFASLTGGESQIWTGHHEANILWFLQDSLDGRRWHRLADGVLNSSRQSGVARISVPIGSKMRVAFRAQPMFAYKRTDDGSVQERKVCVVDHHDDVHAALRVEMLTINAAIRSI
jgi:hypothetical protein